MRRIFIVVPSFSPTGPVKGALALCNAVATHRKVTFVALRPGPGVGSEIAPQVNVMVGPGGRLSGIRFLAKLLDHNGGRNSTTVISYCLSSDFAAFLLRRRTRWVSSVRGDVLKVYRYDFGGLGRPLAILHLLVLRYADAVIAMTHSMAEDIKRFTGELPIIIHNFIDEVPVAQYRARRVGGAIMRFVYVGRLVELKQPLLLLGAIEALRNQGYDVTLDVVGSGPLEATMRRKVVECGLCDSVFFHSYVSNPLPIVAQADALVLPSVTEGTSRAVLEALHLGVPVVMRGIDGSNELINPGVNGVLFSDPDSLSDAMRGAVALRRRLSGDKSLLPSEFRQLTCVASYLKWVDPDV